MPYVAPKPALKSKTIQFNGVLLAIAAVLASVPDAINSPQVHGAVVALPEHWRNVIAAVLGVVAAVNVLLRLVTKQPIGKAE